VSRCRLLPTGPVNANRVTNKSIESTYTPDMSIKWRKIDTRTQQVDRIDMSTKHVEEISKYRHIL
jgi:hypothetical protein